MIIQTPKFYYKFSSNNSNKYKSNRISLTDYTAINNISNNKIVNKIIKMKIV